MGMLARKKSRSGSAQGGRSSCQAGCCSIGNKLLEDDKAAVAALESRSYTPILDEPYRWNSWAAPKNASGQLDHHAALTGDDLREFVNQRLFPYLKGFKQRASGPNTIEYKIGEIFSELSNKISSGYNLREIIDGLDGLRLRSQAEKHELSMLYEEKIKRMGNAGLNGGEHYTPRPLIRAIVQVVNPITGETVYDPAVGSAGFLCEAFEFMRKGGASGAELSTADLDTLQTRTFTGKEKKKPRLCDRDQEHDPARHRSTEDHPRQHAHREP